MTNLWCHPGRSRRRLIGSIAFLCAAILVACSDDGSNSATRPLDDEPYSSVTPQSSDSETSVSSSSSEEKTEPCNIETDENCIKDDRDGKTYRTVTVGNQVWMAENLNYETDSSFCYNDSAEYCAKYGRLYKWAVAVGRPEGECGYGNSCDLSSGNIQGACPNGWHLPSMAEWEILFNAVGDTSSAGKALKTGYGWDGYHGNGTDDFGFSALPSGIREGDGKYSDVGESVRLWSTTEDGSYRAYYVMFSYSGDKAYQFCGFKDYSSSVRCVRDDEEPENSSSSSVQSSSSEDSESSSSSSSSVALAVPCKTETEDNCEYGELVDNRDGQTYRTVKIGDQVWMAENLNYETDSSFCHSNEESNCTKYGRLYRWAAAVDEPESECGYGNSCDLPSENIQGACPNGWHLPNKTEWETLLNAVGGGSTAGTVLKSTSEWTSALNSYYGNGTDAFGFSTLPAGFRYGDGDFGIEGNSGYFWSSTEYDSGFAYYVGFENFADGASWRYYDKYLAFSVRCVKD